MKFASSLLKAACAAFLLGVAPASWAQTEAEGAGPFYLGWVYQRYSEPQMHLAGHGIQAGVNLPIKPAFLLPENVHAAVELASLDYGSRYTGELKDVPSVQWQLSAWWRGPQWVAMPWYTGPVIEGLWTDLQGQSSAGYRGYERFSLRAWWALSIAPVPEARVTAAVLLRGQQNSYLSQANALLPNIVNTQNKGWWLKLELAPCAACKGIQPWLEFKHLAESDKQGRQGWFEPENKQWQMGLRKRF